jgi:hypothetical protein
MPQPADFGGFYINPASNLLAYRIERITTVGKLEAELWRNLQDLENQFLHQQMWYSADCGFTTADFKTEKRVHDHYFRPKLLIHLYHHFVKLSL